jgi:hypothetical protein
MMPHDVMARGVPVGVVPMTHHVPRVDSWLSHGRPLVGNPNHTFDATHGPTDSATGNPA